MRARTGALLKVLNRARPEDIKPKEKKTIRYTHAHAHAHAQARTHTHTEREYWKWCNIVVCSLTGVYLAASFVCSGRTFQQS